MELLDIIKTSRPLGYTIGPLIFLVPIFLHDVALTPIVILHLVLLTFPLCFLLFGLNDIYDIGTDKKNPRKGGVEGAVMDPKDIQAVQSIAAISAISLFIPAILDPDILDLCATTLLVLLAIAYSIPPVRLKEKPPLDSLSNALMVFLIFLMGLSYGPGLSGLPFEVYYLMFGIMGIHIFTTIMDYSPDIDTGILTFSTFFGKRQSAIAASLIFIFILFFSGIQDLVIRSYNVLLILLAAAVIIRPDERLARNMFRVMFLSFLVFITVYLFSIS